MNMKKASVIIVLTSSLVTSNVPVLAAESKVDTVKTESIIESSVNETDKILSDCFDTQKEDELIREVTNGKDKIELTVDNPVELNFEDGSKITYSLEPINSSSNKLLRAKATNGYVAKKVFDYGVSSATVRLTVTTSYSGRSVTIESTSASYEAVFASVSLDEPVIDVKTASNNKYAKCHVSGDFTIKAPYVTDIYSKSIKVVCEADPAGLFYVK